MKTLVAVASRHGGTMEIGERIGACLRESDLDVDVHPIDRVNSLAAYDAAIIGSAVYMGRWLGQGRDFVEVRATELSRMNVWLFSSGPISGRSDPHDADDGLRLLEAVNGREHKLFAGRLEKDDLGLTERFIVRMVHPVYGDYRPWDDIDQWARAIAYELRAVPA